MKVVAIINAKGGVGKTTVSTHAAVSAEGMGLKRLRDMIQAKLKGEGIEVGETAQPAVSNVVDLMATLRRSLADRHRPSKPSYRRNFLIS
jgi:non-homologous end joining protein Ku